MAAPGATGSHSEVVAAANLLTARWARSAFTGESTVISVVGAWPLLAILAASAEGPARNELEAAVGRPSAEGFKDAAALLQMLHASPAVQAALGIWTADIIPILEGWRAAVPPASWSQLLHDGSDAKRLDQWASSQTHGLIDKFPLAIDPDSLLVLATALLVQTRWIQPFKPDFSPLRASSGPWMRRADLACLDRRSADLDDLRIADSTPAGPLTLMEVRGSDDISVILVLANEQATAGPVVAEALSCLAAPDSLRLGSTLHVGDSAPGVTVHLTPSPSPEPVLDLLTVPFQIGSNHDLLKLKDLFGLTAASDAFSGHFPHISPAPLYVGAAAQTASAAFSAEGFVAAAVTAIEMLMGSMRPKPPAGQHLEVRVRFDRPFGFITFHRPTHLALVAGWVALPQSLAPAA